MPYITSLVLVYLISRSLCLLITIQYSLPQLSTSGNQKFLLFYHELVFVHFLKKNWPSFYFLKHNRVVASLAVQMIKDLPAMQESWVRSIGWEDPLEKGMATHISILAWRIPCITYWFNIYIYSKMITTISLATTCHHTKILQY